jgi:Flp pilus assembly protein TadG
MRIPHRRVSRRGAAAVEAAIVLPVFLLIVLGVIDLGAAVFRYNTLSQAARHGARQAMVHGDLALAGWNGGPWTGTANDPSGGKMIDVRLDSPSTPVEQAAVDAVRPMLVNCPPSQTWVRVTWPAGTNEVGDSVRVTVTSTYTPMTSYIVGGVPISLSAASNMPIAH